jgi:CRP/FNR family transcriptional regulator, cyclic AMP receptor protein
MTMAMVDLGGIALTEDIPLSTKMTTRNTPKARRNAGGRLDLLDVINTSVCYRPCETIFAQGDRCAAVMYIRKGGVKLTVTSRTGREAVIGVIHAGEFFGEGALAGQRRRRCTAETVTASTIAMVMTGEMRRRLHEGVGFSDWFRSHMLARNIRMEADLVGQLFNRCDKRLARVLLLLANFDEHQLPRAALPKISRNLLAETIGTTRAKVDLLMNKFRKLGFLERNGQGGGGLQVHRSMLSVVLQD